MITSSVIEETAKIKADFSSAKPFKHVCIEGFLQPQWAETLLADFPNFDAKKAIDEFGHVGRKAVRTDMREISANYRRFYDYVSSAAFLGIMSEFTGIPALEFDHQMYGGGTHENLEGQTLDAHVDFNYDQERKRHRRLNLLIYLNKEWDVSWGGAIQLHSDPRDPTNDLIETYNCTFNRCIIFETNEHSWHGFRQIRLPESKRGLTRKCISIYLYTRERPQDEIVPEHATFYVQDPLPDHFASGHALSLEDLQEINRLVASREAWIKHYGKMEQEMGGENRSLRSYAETLQLYVKAGIFLSYVSSNLSIRRLTYSGLALYLRGKTRLKALFDRELTAQLPPSSPKVNLRENHVLSQQDVDALGRQLMVYDGYIKDYQQMELDLRRENDTLKATVESLLTRIRLPMRGGIRQQANSIRGAYAAGWISSNLRLKIHPKKSALALVMTGYVPQDYPAGMVIEAYIDGASAGRITPEPGKMFDLLIKPRQRLETVFSLDVRTTSVEPRVQRNGDQRDLAFMLLCLSAQH